jgi:hypothetical protein
MIIFSMKWRKKMRFLTSAGSATVSPAKNARSLFECFSLYVSQVCLGKNDDFYYKTAQKMRVFRTVSGLGFLAERELLGRRGCGR